VSARRTASLLESFNYALEGIIHVLRTHRNMRFHFAAAVAVLVAGVWAGVDRIELAALLISIAFVLIAEMVNSALEAAIDMATTSFDPLAKLAKDIAAGAVLIAAINAVAVGYLVFSHKVSAKASKGLDRLRDAPAEVTAIALIVTILIVIGTKAYTGRGRPLRGGLPSGHAAIAFSGWMAATYLISPGEHRFLAAVIMLIMALLVAQTRVEAGFHSALEVVYGGVLGALTTLVIFQVFS
jgi:diacylglycerol kinase (ATP)